MYRFGRNILVAISFFVLIVCVIAITPHEVDAQAVAQKTASAADPGTRQGPWAYRKVAIGMKAEEARKTLGNPRDKADDQDLYLFTDDELAQVYYDANHLITAISITFYKDLTKAPTAKDVLGEDARPNADGSIFKSVRFSKAGYSVSYSKTAGDSPSVSITFQKM